MLTIAELAGRRLRDDLLGEAGAPAEPLLVVDLASDGGDVPAAVDAARRLAGRSAVLVGVATGPLPGVVDPLVEELDLTLLGDGRSANDRRVVGGGPEEEDRPAGAGRSAIDQRVVAGQAEAEHGSIGASGPTDDRRLVVGEPEPVLARIEASVDRCPVAAISLCGVLRATSALPVEVGLLVESFAYSTLLAGPEHAAWLAARDARPAAPGDGAAVRADRIGDRLTITLDRPDRRNAYSRQVRDELVQALTVLDVDDTIAEVELRGAGPAFCSGGDLAEFGCLPDPATAHVIRTSRSAASLLHRHRDRVHVHVHGACIGAGAELPAFARQVTAAPDAWFQLPELAMGLIPGAGGTVSITGRIGRWRTALLALTGDHLPAQTAAEWGLVDDLAPV